MSKSKSMSIHNCYRSYLVETKISEIAFKAKQRQAATKYSSSRTGQRGNTNSTTSTASTALTLVV